ncbi:lycopene cyclase domain-containing protein [Georgenia sp. Z1344]|uniref:lycopene cyclase domain-containing protein n=1 Tax=Georgenia sp. Z1344 TaxID=3416706 RepID=UPI003CF4A109
MTYLVLCAIFLPLSALVLAAGLLRSGRARALVRAWWLPALVTAALLAVLTVVFDNLMVAAGLFDYDWDGLTGVRLGRIPVEDLAYPLGALVLLPGVWLLLAPRRDARRDAEEDR